MSATALLARKEFRAQAGLWCAIVAGMLAGKLPGHDLGGSEVFFYVLGALALGAGSIGHEYRYGTMAQLLAQPIARTRILVVKLGVLALALLTIAALAKTIAVPLFQWHPTDRDRLIALFVLPVPYGLVVAPWLALKTRSTLAGMIFSGSLAALLIIIGDRVGASMFGSDREIDAFTLKVLWTGSAALCVCAAADLWRSVGGLQVSDAVRSDISLPRLTRATALRRVGTAAAPARRHPIVQLVFKELRLQQMTLVGSAIYLLIFLVIYARRSTWTFDDAVTVATLIHAIVVATLAGALSCTEERVMGTVEWQLLQPMSVRNQFAVKAAVTVALTLLLAMGLPTLLSFVLRAPIGGPLRGLDMAAILVLLLSGSMVVSTASANAPSAFFACVPAFMVALWFLQDITARLAFSVYSLSHRAPDGRFMAIHQVPSGVGSVVEFAFILLLLAIAFDNYRPADRSLRRWALQVVAVAALFAATCVAFAAAGRLLYY